MARKTATPEMAGYFAEELAANARKGLRNEVSEVKFLQGDLSAWRNAEYATVAMRFSLIDKMADRVSGKIVSGDPAVPQEATELWTFTRRVGAPLGIGHCRRSSKPDGRRPDPAFQGSEHIAGALPTFTCIAPYRHPRTA
jgi:hypothetical protein